jgi:hypothetical protein
MYIWFPALTTNRIYFSVANLKYCFFVQTDRSKRDLARWSLHGVHLVRADTVCTVARVKFTVIWWSRASDSTYAGSSADANSN